MKRRALMQIAVVTAAGAGLLYLGYRIPGTILCIMAGLLLILAIVAPGVLQTLQELGIRLGSVVGTGIGVVTLTLVYCSVFSLGSLWLRLRSVDPLQRRFPGEGSNWIDRVGFGTEKSLYAKPYSHPHGDRQSKDSRA